MQSVLENDVIYPVPRWRPLAWFVRSGRAPIPEIQNGLRSTFFQRMSSLVAVSIANATMMAVLMLRHTEPAYIAWGTVVCSLEVVRLIAIAVICRAIGTRSLQYHRYVVDCFVASTLLWALLLGCSCWLGLWSGDTVLMVFGLVMSVGVVGALSGRNPGSPRLSAALMIFIMVPVTVGLLISPETGMRWLALLLPPYLWGMGNIISQLHDDYVAMLTAQWENRHRALHCSLTGLRNVRHFYELLAAAIVIQSTGPVAVLALDLDGFKAVNDRYGHPVGDALLKSVADRIQVFESPTVLGARIGGDEFALVLLGQDAQSAESLADNLIHEISRPYSLADVSASVGVSIGIARCRSAATTPATLHAQADKALYRAKADSKGRWRVYADEPLEIGSVEPSPSGRDCGRDANMGRPAQQAGIRQDREVEAA